MLISACSKKQRLALIQAAELEELDLAWLNVCEFGP